MVFQDPFTSLNPVTPIGEQLVQFQHHKRGRRRRERLDRAADMLRRVGITDPLVRLRQYPFELSGGMRQRILIAAALLTEPRLLIADEPTTALDATTEVQIVQLLRESRALVSGAMVVVTHDIALVDDLCDQVAVMYAGEVVEVGATRQVLYAPRHPYTRALLECDPAKLQASEGAFPFIPGQTPDPMTARAGCAFAPRCRKAVAPCHIAPAAMISAGLGGDFLRCGRADA